MRTNFEGSPSRGLCVRAERPSRGGRSTVKRSQVIQGSAGLRGGINHLVRHGINVDLLSESSLYFPSTVLFHADDTSLLSPRELPIFKSLSTHSGRMHQGLRQGDVLLVSAGTISLPHVLFNPVVPVT